MAIPLLGAAALGAAFAASDLAVRKGAQLVEAHAPALGGLVERAKGRLARARKRSDLANEQRETEERADELEAKLRASEASSAQKDVDARIAALQADADKRLRDMEAALAAERASAKSAKQKSDAERRTLNLNMFRQAQQRASKPDAGSELKELIATALTSITQGNVPPDAQVFSPYVEQYTYDTDDGYYF